ncbi:hypothetical protein [Gottfriedia solisilvae]|uniref:hypothetical protein n=1 Tax=Gottfriedia solisilvae TaxID=1516104 RepID=UPI003D2F13A6
MDYAFKAVTIYVDSKDNLFNVPNGISEKYGGASMEIDKIRSLDSPYTDNQIEELLKDALSLCFSLNPNEEDTSLTPIEKFLGVKGYAKAVKDKKLIVLNWNIDEGYYITPTEKLPRKGYAHLKKYRINLGLELMKGELAKAVRDAIQLSKI